MIEFVFQEELREYLLVLPEESSDSKVLLLAGKILLYYAENIQVSLEKLVMGVTQ